jgi:hypothetical protein
MVALTSDRDALHLAFSQPTVYDGPAVGVLSEGLATGTLTISDNRDARSLLILSADEMHYQARPR